MKNFTKLLFITALCCAFSVNAQFRLVKDINTGAPNSTSVGFHEYNGRLFFSAITSGTTRRVHATDGTTMGTIGLSLNSVSSGLYADHISPRDPIINFIEHNSELYFNVSFWSSGFLRPYIVKLIGSNNYTEPGGVFSLYDALGVGSDAVFLDPCLHNDKIFFSPGRTGSNGMEGVEPYLLDLLTPANNGVLLDIYPGQVPPFMSDPYNSLPRSFTALSSGVMFSAYNPTNGRELWKTDGTSAGTVLFNDLNSGTADSNPTQFNVLGGQLTFVATHTTLGRELFKTNGNTGNLILVKDINTSGDSNPINIKDVNGTLYFSADNGSIGQELWKSNGTNLGTLLIKDINPTGNSNPSKFIQFGFDVYFTADDGTNGIELWKTNGTNAGTILVKNINPSGSSSPNHLTVYNGKLYFTANNGTNGIELWVTDGTNLGTTMIELNTSGDAIATNLIVFNNELYMAADAGDGIGQELWAYQDPALSIDSFELENKITLFPNPAQNYFEIETTETLSKVEVYSLEGQSLKSFVPQNQYDISDLSSGIYFVKIKANNEEITKRIVKE